MPKFSETCFQELHVLLHLTFLTEFSVEWFAFSEIQQFPDFLEISFLEVFVPFFLALKFSGYMFLCHTTSWNL